MSEGEVPDLLWGEYRTSVLVEVFGYHLAGREIFASALPHRSPGSVRLEGWTHRAIARPGVRKADLIQPEIVRLLKSYGQF